MKMKGVWFGVWLGFGWVGWGLVGLVVVWLGWLGFGWVVRGLLLAKVPNSSFAEAHRGFISEPTHIEDEVEDQEDKVEDERDCEECKVDSRREVRHTSA